MILEWQEMVPNIWLLGQYTITLKGRLNIQMSETNEYKKLRSLLFIQSPVNFDTAHTLWILDGQRKKMLL